MKKNDRVSKSPMWKYDVAHGTVTQVKRDGYVVVVWDGVNGEWHYTPEQAETLEILG